VSKLSWDEWFIKLAATVALKSKDPSTQVGALIVRRDRTIVSAGFNGFPRGIEDTDERLNDRPTKYGLIIHAEMNAIITARENLSKCTLYTSFMPCDRCFVHVIQSQIKRVVFPKATADQESRWGEAFTKVRVLATEAKINLVELP
jgi:dCMP deaminase